MQQLILFEGMISGSRPGGLIQTTTVHTHGVPIPDGFTQITFAYSINGDWANHSTLTFALEGSTNGGATYTDTGRFPITVTSGGEAEGGIIAETITNFPPLLRLRISVDGTFFISVSILLS